MPLGRFWLKRPGNWYPYVVAVVATAGVVSVRWLLDPLVQHQAPMLLLTLAVIVAAYVGGLGPGLVATGLCMIAGRVLFVQSAGVTWDMSTADQVRFAIFLVVGVVMSLLSESMHRARQRTQEGVLALRESEWRFRGAFENAAVGMAHLDLAGQVLGVNQKLCDILGYSRQEMFGKNFRDFTYPEDVALDWGWFGALVRGERGSYAVTKRYIRKDGSPVWTQVTRALQRDETGRPIYSISVVQDITQQKIAEQALQASEARLRGVLEALPVGVFIADEHGKLLEMNRAAKQIWDGQAPLSESPEHYARDYKGWWPDGRPVEAGEWALARAVGRGEVCTAEEVEIETAEGLRKTILNYALPIRDAQGQISGGVAVNVDITDRKRSEEALRAAVEQADQANQAKDHFLAVLSHELRTPLTPVVVAAGMLAKDGRLPEEVREDLQMIRRNAELEKRLIDDLLDLTRIARGKLQIDMRPIDAAAVLRHAVEVCGSEAEAKGVELAVHIVEGRRRVWADEGRLQQVFWNLLTNAIKFTPAGGRISVRCCDDANGRLVAEVSDTGIGIDPAALERIFQPFEQQDRAVTQRFGGLGLGLAISKAIVEQHGGAIQVHSDGQGQGTRFTVELPRLEEAPGRGDSSDGADGATPGGHGRKLRILLVEDHADTAKLMGRILRLHGHQVQVAGNVASALELVEREDLDLIISDLGLPDGSGHDLMRRVRSRHPALKGIALSGYGQESDVQKSSAAGFMEHVTKPVDIGHLEAAIARAVNDRR